MSPSSRTCLLILTSSISLMASSLKSRSSRSRNQNLADCKNKLSLNDFTWVNDRFNFKLDKKETIDWCKDTNFQAVGFLCCYENDEVIVGTHNVIEPNALDSTVMFIAKIEDGKIISHQYLREFQR